MPDSITVTMILALRPEAVEPFCTRFPVMVEETRAFPGFRDIRVLHNADRPNEVILIEEWDSRADHEAYVAFRTETGVMDQTAQMVTEPPRLDYWDIPIV